MVRQNHASSNTPVAKTDRNTPVESKDLNTSRAIAIPLDRGEDNDRIPLELEGQLFIIFVRHLDLCVSLQDFIGLLESNHQVAPVGAKLTRATLKQTDELETRYGYAIYEREDVMETVIKRVDKYSFKGHTLRVIRADFTKGKWKTSGWKWQDFSSAFRNRYASSSLAKFSYIEDHFHKDHYAPLLPGLHSRDPKNDGDRSVREEGEANKAVSSWIKSAHLHVGNGNHEPKRIKLESDQTSPIRSSSVIQPPPPPSAVKPTLTLAMSIVTLSKTADPRKRKIPRMDMS